MTNKESYYSVTQSLCDSRSWWIEAGFPPRYPVSLFTLAHWKVGYSTGAGPWDKMQETTTDQIPFVRNAPCTLYPGTSHSHTYERCLLGLDLWRHMSWEGALPCPYRWRAAGTGATLLWLHHWRPRRKNPFWTRSLLMTSGCLRSTGRANKTVNVSFSFYKYLYMEMVLTRCHI